MSKEYQIAIFGTVIRSQNGLFRLDEIRREGISIGKVEDNDLTMPYRFGRTKVGRYLTTLKKGGVKKINMGHIGTSWLATPAAACEFARWLDFEYGLSVSEAFMEMTHSETIQEAVSLSVSVPEPVKAFIAAHGDREKDNRAYAFAGLKRRR